MIRAQIGVVPDTGIDHDAKERQMKNIMCCATATVLSLTAGAAVMAPAPAQAEVTGAICATGGCTPVDPVTAGIAIVVGSAVSIEKSCREDKEKSCTEEAKKAGQNAIDYLRFKKNPAKALERRFKKIF